MEIHQGQIGAVAARYLRRRPFIPGNADDCMADAQKDHFHFNCEDRLVLDNKNPRYHRAKMDLILEQYRRRLTPGELPRTFNTIHCGSR